MKILTPIVIAAAASLSGCASFDVDDFFGAAEALAEAAEGIDLNAENVVPANGSATYEGIAFGAFAAEAAAPKAMAADAAPAEFVAVAGTLTADVDFAAPNATVDGTIDRVGMATVTEADLAPLYAGGLLALDQADVEDLMDMFEAADGSFDFDGVIDTTGDPIGDLNIAGTVTGDAGELTLGGTVLGGFTGATAEVFFLENNGDLEKTLDGAAAAGELVGAGGVQD